jgi:GWxTD domain-containing protein
MRSLLIVFLSLLAGIPQAAKAVEATVNRAQFRHGDGSVYLEIYWQINPTSLHYHKDSLGRLSSRIQTVIHITSDQGKTKEDHYELQTLPFDPRQTEAPTTLDKASIDLSDGNYQIELQLYEEAYPQQKFIHRDSIVVSELKNPEVSGVQLLDTFFASKDPSQFQKRGFQQLPRVLPFYDEGQFRVHAYSEFYPTQSLTAESYPLQRTVFISRQKGQRDLGGHFFIDTIKSYTAIAVSRQTFDMEDVGSGNYYVNSVVRTAQGNQIASQSTFFQTLNKNPRSKTVEKKDSGKSVEQSEGVILDLSKTFVAKFDMAQLMAILKMLLPTANAAEVSAIKGFLDRPDELYVRYFIYNHFFSINKADPAKAWKEFADVIRVVNKQFKMGSTMGYETDRGIIYLRFGAPEEVIRVPSESGAYPYEIWRYNVGGKIGGSGLFLFYSPGFMISDFRLLHSTVPGERNNPNWRSALYTTGGTGSSRAEEYFGQ